jgi:carbon starvation protein
MVNSGRGRYAPITLIPMLFVTATTMTAGANLIGYQFPAIINAGEFWKGWLSTGFALFVMTCVGTLLLIAAARWVSVWMRGNAPTPKRESW